MTSAPEDQNGLREALARAVEAGFDSGIRHSGDGSITPDAHYDAALADAIEEAVAAALIAGPLASLIAERDAAVANQRAMLIQVGEHARARGEAEGALLISEKAGIVEGWRDRALAAEAEITRLKEGMEARWRSMDTAPNGVPIYAKHQPNEHTPHGWIALIRRRAEDPDEGRGCGRDTILHYNGDASLRGFYGCWTGWLWPEELATLSPKEQP